MCLLRSPIAVPQLIPNSTREVYVSKAENDVSGYRRNRRIKGCVVYTESHLVISIRPYPLLSNAKEYDFGIPLGKTYGQSLSDCGSSFDERVELYSIVRGIK